MKKYNKRLSRLGFTLIEMVICIAVIGIISVLGGKVIFQAVQGYSDNQAALDADWQIKVSLERMQRDIRNMASPATITTMTASSFSFTDTNGNLITYTLDGTTLNMLQTGTAAKQPLAVGLTALTFTYFDRNNASTAIAANVRYISINMTVGLTLGSYNVLTTIYGRNLQ